MQKLYPVGARDPNKLDQNSSQVSWKQSRIWGVSCDGSDDLGQRILPKLQAGDWVVYPEIGDYSNELVTVSFNGFKPPEMHYCCEKRDLQRVKDLLDGEFQFIYDFIE